MMKKLLSLILLLLFIGFTHAYAEEGEPIKPEPNRYEKRKINIQNNFRDNLTQKESLPELQKDLTFEKPKTSKHSMLKDQLFQSIEEEKNTITSKAEQLGLFAKNESPTRFQNKEEQFLPNTSKLTFVLIGAVIIVIGAMFILVMPRLNRVNTN